MNLFSIRRSALAAVLLLVAVSTASAQTSTAAAKSTPAVTVPNPKFNGLPEPVRPTFRRIAAGGRVDRILPVGYFYVGSVTTRDGRSIQLRVRLDGSIRSQLG